MPSPDGRHSGRCAAVKFGIGLHRVVEVGVTPKGQVVQRHRCLHEVALCILGWLQPGEDRPQMAHYGRGSLTDHWTHLQQHSFIQLLSSSMVRLLTHVHVERMQRQRHCWTHGYSRNQPTKDDHAGLILAVH